MQPVVDTRKEFNVTTTSILNSGNTIAVDVAAWKAADKAAHVLIDQKESDDGLRREAYFQLKAGDKAYPRIVRIGRYISPNANEGIGSQQISVRINDHVQRVSSDGDVEYTKPGYLVLSTNMAGDLIVPDETAFMEMVMEAATWIVQVASGVVSNGAVDDLSYGIVSTALEHANSAST
jgi:hypothetical protein